MELSETTTPSTTTNKNDSPAQPKDSKSNTNARTAPQKNENATKGKMIQTERNGSDTKEGIMEKHSEQKSNHNNPKPTSATILKSKTPKIQFALNPKKRRGRSMQREDSIGGSRTNKRHAPHGNVLGGDDEEEEGKTKKLWNLASFTTESATSTNNAKDTATEHASLSLPNSSSSGGSSGFSSGDSFGSEDEESIFALETIFHGKEGSLGHAVEGNDMRGVAPPVRKDETVESIAVQAEKEQDQQEEQHVSEGEASMAANKPQHQTVEPSPSPTATTTTPAQPEGWRVKLYLLNSDGSWKDCGTGRIVCLISPKKNGENSNGNGRIRSSQSENDNEKIEMEALQEEIYQEMGEPTLFMHAEIQPPQGTGSSSVASPPKVLLRTRVLVKDEYQRQGDNIITWCAPVFSNGPVQQELSGNDRKDQEQFSGVDLALSFQDNIGCLDIWNKITKLQNSFKETFEARGGLVYEKETSVVPEDEELGDANRNDSNQGGEIDGSNISPERYRPNDEYTTGESNGKNDVGVGNGVHFVDRKHQMYFENIMNELNQQGMNEKNNTGGMKFDVDEERLESLKNKGEVDALSMAAAQFVSNRIAANNGQGDQHEMSQACVSPQLPNPPKLGNLEVIVGIISAAHNTIHPQQKEAISQFLSLNDCAYLKALLELFPSAESQDDYLYHLASTIKGIILLNDPDIINMVIADGEVFEMCCCCLEYDPDLRDKANHMWFIRDRLKFRTVLLMEDEELISAIHQAFRITYIRDTLLRPTMDESSLSSLSSLLQFTHDSIVKRVVCAAPSSQHEQRTRLDSESCDSYLIRIIRLLGREVIRIREMELNNDSTESNESICSSQNGYDRVGECKEENTMSSTWGQYLAPQDNSIISRKVRRLGCLSFLRELFNMIRMSVQDRGEITARIVQTKVNVGIKGSKIQSSDDETVNLLMLLGTIQSDPNSTVSERIACLEIISAISVHDSSLIRNHCLQEFESAGGDLDGNRSINYKNQPVPRPQPNDRRQVTFVCPPNDLLLSLLYLMAAETDAGIMLQTTEVMRDILDDEMPVDSEHIGGVGVIDNEDDLLSEGTRGNGLIVEQSQVSNGAMNIGSEQNAFLQMFYEHYVPWLVAPFQYSIFIAKLSMPFSSFKKGVENKNSTSLAQILSILYGKQKTIKNPVEILFIPVEDSTMRTSFAVELLNECIRSHSKRMKRFLLTSRVLGSVLKYLKPNQMSYLSSDRCLKLAALRCLRSILTLKDEFYHRHIVQQDLFRPVFEAFRDNPVGDNLVSSAIIEMCDFIKSQKIKSLLEYIVTKYLKRQSVSTPTGSEILTTMIPSLEEVASPYVKTLTNLRQEYEINNQRTNFGGLQDSNDRTGNSNASSFEGGRRVSLNERAMEDQRKFRETDEEESYFFDDPAPLSPSSRHGLNI